MSLRRYIIFGNSIILNSSLQNFRYPHPNEYRRAANKLFESFCRRSHHKCATIYFFLINENLHRTHPAGLMIGARCIDHGEGAPRDNTKG